jgi:hypothetical protein
MPVIDLRFPCKCKSCGASFPAGAPMMWPAELCRDCSNAETQEALGTWKRILTDPPAGLRVYALRELPVKRIVSRFSSMKAVQELDRLARKVVALDEAVSARKIIDFFLPPTPAALKEERGPFEMYS